MYIDSLDSIYEKQYNITDNERLYVSNCYLKGAFTTETC